jgi:CubicO group peptidase (beta-lactamase class C family)
MAPGSRAGSPEPFFLFATGEGRAAVQESLAATGATAVSLALVDGDRFTWTEQFGFKEVGNGRALAAGEETLFGLGPATRLVTAIAIMKLAEGGQLRLDDPVARHLPEFRMRSPEFRRITLRMLLSGSSGLPGSDLRNQYTTAPFPDYPKQVLATLAHQRLRHAPGTLHSGGDDGYTLLEAVVAKVTLGSYAEFVQKAILDPLGMQHSQFGDRPLPHAACARVFRGKDRLPMEYANACGAAGLYTTPADMARLLAMLVQGGTVKGERILDPASIQEMGRDQTRGSFNPMPSPLAAAGLGWDTVNHPALRAAGVQAWSIQGETPHYGCAILVVPAERMGVIVMGATGFPGAAAASVAERIVLRKLMENKSIPEMPRAGEALALAEAGEPEEPLARLWGLYASHAAAYRVGPGTFHDTLALEQYQPETRAWRPVAKDLRLRVDGWFAADGDPAAGFRFLAAGQRHYLARRWSTRFCRLREMLAERVGSMLAPEWRNLAGRTWVLANEAPASMVPESERRLELLILPGADDVLFVRGHGFYPVDASRNEPRARVALRLPGPAGSDMDGLEQLSLNGELWLRSGSRLFRPLVPIQAPAFQVDPAEGGDPGGPWIPE